MATKKKAARKKAKKAKKPTHILFIRHNRNATEGRAHLVDGIKGAKEVLSEHYGFSTNQFELFEIKNRSKLKVSLEFV